MKYNVAAKSAVGCIRRNNEDNLILDGEILPLEHKDSALISRAIASEGIKLFGVFDGMGGYSDGEKASYIAAVTAMEKVKHKPDNISHEEFLHSLCMEMNDEVFKEADGSGMGTTCALLCLDGRKYTACNVGDSPIFMVRDGRMCQISEDHNQKATYERIMGKQARPERKFKLTQCIGISQQEMLIDPFISSGNLRENDVFLLCSDGLTDMMNLNEICGILNSDLQVECMVEKLASRAVNAGGRDNITIICVKIQKNSICVKHIMQYLFEKCNFKMR